MSGFLSILALLLIIALIVLFIWWLIYRIRLRNGQTFKHSWGKITVYVLIALIVVFVAGTISEPSSSKSASSSSSSQTSSQKKHAKKISESKAESSSLKKEESSERKVNEKKHAVEYKRALSNMPSETKNAVTDAYYSTTESTTFVTVNNEIEAGTDAQLKSSVHGAWQIAQNYQDKYSPMPDSITPYVTVRDENGTKLAHTSMFGSFKYDGDN